MTTVIQQPSQPEKSGDSIWNFLGILLVVAVILFLIFYAIPLLRNSQSQIAPQINIPDKIDVNVNQGQ